MSKPLRARASRVAANIAISVAFACCGFLLAAVSASRAGVADGQGLAGGAIVLGYGLPGAMGGLLAAWMLLRLLSPRYWRWLAGVSIVVCAALLVIGVRAWLFIRGETARHLEQSYEQLPAFHLELQPGPVVDGLLARRFVADWGERWFEVSVDDRVCKSAMTGEQAVLLLSALREAELVLYRHAEACRESGAVVTQRLVFDIQEALPPVTHVDVGITVNCLAQYPALGAPSRAAASLMQSRGRAATCVPP